MSAIQDPLESLKIRFCARLVEDRTLLAQSASIGDTGTLRSICHRIAGAGGMFGYDHLSKLASALEEAIDDEAALWMILDSSAEIVAVIDRLVAENARR